MVVSFLTIVLSFFLVVAPRLLRRRISPRRGKPPVGRARTTTFVIMEELSETTALKSGEVPRLKGPRIFQWNRASTSRSGWAPRR